MKFKVGDKVYKISNMQAYHDRKANNTIIMPNVIEGVIVKIRDSNFVDVRWNKYNGDGTFNVKKLYDNEIDAQKELLNFVEDILNVTKDKLKIISH